MCVADHMRADQYVCLPFTFWLGNSSAGLRALIAQSLSGPPFLGLYTPALTVPKVPAPVQQGTQSQDQHTSVYLSIQY